MRAENADELLDSFSVVHCKETSLSVTDTQAHFQNQKAALRGAQDHQILSIFHRTS